MKKPNGFDTLQVTGDSTDQHQETLLEASLRFRDLCIKGIILALETQPKGVLAIDIYREVSPTVLEEFGGGSEYTWSAFESHITWLADQKVIDLEGEVVKLTEHLR